MFSEFMTKSKTLMPVKVSKFIMFSNWTIPQSKGCVLLLYFIIPILWNYDMI